MNAGLKSLLASTSKGMVTPYVHTTCTISAGRSLAAPIDIRGTEHYLCGVHVSIDLEAGFFTRFSMLVGAMAHSAVS